LIFHPNKNQEKPLSKKQVGEFAEQLAANYLTEHGYRLITRNFRGDGGEIDIIAWNDKILCFVEVRARENADFGDPLETINRPKIARIAKAARQFLEQFTEPWQEIRFDAVGILLHDLTQICLIQGAFEI